eukprot:9956310-Ditylum_brightwellii.AAC.1
MLQTLQDVKRHLRLHRPVLFQLALQHARRPGYVRYVLRGGRLSDHNVRWDRRQQLLQTADGRALAKEFAFTVQ